MDERVGGGSVFWFTVKLLHASGAPVHKHLPAASTSSTAKKVGRVLLAEDHPVNVQVATMMLEGAGFDVDVAEDGAHAITAVSRGDYDLVLMDVHMPVLDGLSATRQIRQSEGNGRRLPIIALTASASHEDRFRCLDAGMDDYVSKPFRKDVLIDRVTHWIERSAVMSKLGDVDGVVNIDQLSIIDDEQIVSLEQLFAKDKFLELLCSCLSDVEGKVESLVRAKATMVVPEIHRGAHMLISVAGTFGMRRVQELAGNLQAACAAGMPPAGLIDRIATECAMASEVLRRTYELPLSRE